MQSVGNLAQQFHVDAVPVQEDPFFVMMLAEIAFVRGHIQPGYHLGRFLGGHAVTDFLRFALQDLAIVGGFQFLSVFHNRIRFS